MPNISERVPWVRFCQGPGTPAQRTQMCLFDLWQLALQTASQPLSQYLSRLLWAGKDSGIRQGWTCIPRDVSLHSMIVRHLSSITREKAVSVTILKRYIPRKWIAKLKLFVLTLKFCFDAILMEGDNRILMHNFFYTKVESHHATKTLEGDFLCYTLARPNVRSHA